MLNIVCVKTGDKYSPEYVNKLRNMVTRNLSMEFRFVCFTDDASGLDNDIYRLPAIFDGWWSKLQVFDEGFFEDGEYILFIDLDTIIIKDLDGLVNFGIQGLQSLPLIIIEDFNRPFGYGSGLFMIKANSLTEVYESFIHNVETVTQTYRGDQDFLEFIVPDVEFWPREWVLSYKVDELNTKALPDTAKVVCFHGPPKNHEVDDGWVRELWI